MPRPSKATAPIAEPQFEDNAQAIALLQKLLLATRVRSMVGYQLGRCLNCNRPHLRGICHNHCPCHEALEFLDKLGLKPDMQHRS